MSKRLPPKAPELSRVIKTELVMPGNSNIHGTLFGGKLMEWMDIAGSVCARRHSLSQVVTASIDEIFFFSPIHVGDIVTLEARINHTGRSSMEVEICAASEDPATGEKKHTNQAFFTFVAVDERGRPVPVPPLRLDSDEARRRFEAGAERKRERTEHMRSKKARDNAS